MFKCFSLQNIDIKEIFAKQNEFMEKINKNHLIFDYCHFYKTENSNWSSFIFYINLFDVILLFCAVFGSQKIFLRCKFQVYLAIMFRRFMAQIFWAALHSIAKIFWNKIPSIRGIVISNEFHIVPCKNRFSWDLFCIPILTISRFRLSLRSSFLNNI